jgi:hypothetical protein
MSLRFPSWLRVKPERRLVTKLPAPKMTFLGEQDGPVERTLKTSWLPILSARPEIRRAFLVRTAYEGPNDIHVVLALCSNNLADRTLVEELRVPFAAIFSRDTPLDMLFIDPVQESEIEKVCRPFYAAV